MAQEICGITSGVGTSCLELKRTGGLAKRLWAFNITDLRSPIDVDATTYITTIELITYATLYPFDGGKFHASANAELVKSDAGNISFTHTVNMNLVNTNPTDDAVLETLAVADTGWIVQTMNNEFLIYGAGNGLSAGTLSTPTGKAIGDSSTAPITLTGTERSLAKRLLVGGTVGLTLAWLNAHVA